MARHLALQERDRIAQLLHQGAEQREIAQAVGRSPATISRELRRNRTGHEYYAAQAQRQAEQRRSRRLLVRKMDDLEINQAVRAGLAQDWAPEQIAGRMQQQAADHQVSAQTIYTWIKQDEDHEHWESLLRRRGKRPCWRKNATVAAAARIEQRPEVIEQRQRLRLGDFEGDTVLGPAGSGGLATLVDRKSRLTIVVKIQSKHADHVHEKIKQRLQELDEQRRRSITFDNGTAERGIRPAVIIRKNSYGNRSERGADCQAVLMSIFRTLKQRGHDPIRTITDALPVYLKTGQLPPLPQPKPASDG